MRTEKRFLVAGTILLGAWLSGCGGAGSPAGPAVGGWTETVVIPTYPVGPASEFPHFGRREIYPYTRQDDMSFDRRDMGYEAYVLQNEYLRIEVLPALGGRLFAMYDRVTGQDALYRQVSIKPGLVGLRGAWISGGIEWNFPRGHSVTTYDTVSCQLLRHDDGSASIVVGDTERAFRVSWTVQLRLRPGRAFVETRIICRNPTAVAHSASWWSNAGFPANDQTQIIFPFNKVTGHGGEGLSDWPVRQGTDMSWYKEYPRATSIFRAAGEEDFMAAYDHGQDLGLAQWADRHVMPGRKWWTWGTSDAGMRWARTLSDDARPYVEIQSGYPLTQGEDFEMQPHEEREFLEYWMPVTRIGPPARINPEAVVRLTVEKGVATVGVLPTGRIDRARIELSAGGRLLGRWQQTISPAAAFKADCPLGGADPGEVWLRVSDQAGRLVVAHRYGHYAASEPLIEPRPRRWWEDGGRRPEPEKLELATERIKQGSFAEAKQVLEGLLAAPGKDVDADAVRYYLGVAEAGLGRSDAALAHWDAVAASSKLKNAAVMEGAKLLLAAGKWQQAVERLQPLTTSRPAHALAQVYAAVALRQLGRKQQAEAQLRQALRRDPLMLLGQVELAVLEGRGLEGLSALRDEQSRIEAAAVCMEIRQYETAERLLRPAAGAVGSATAAYLRAYVAELAGDAGEAARLRKEAARSSVRGCMPSRREELAAVEAALRADPKDANAHYLAGLVLHGKNRPAEAIEHWREAAALGHTDAAVYHCLGMVVGRDKPAEAVSYLERAAELAPEAMPVYADLDRAYQRAGQTAKRVSMLERAAARLPQRHELAHQLALAYFDAGRYDDAVKVYLSRQFRVAEGEYQLHDDYAAALMARAMTHLAAGRNRQALADLDAAMDYPENLGIGRPDRAGADATIHYWRGVALNSLGQAAEAKKEWSQAAEGGRLSRRMSPWSAERGLHAVHAIMALRRLGEAARAEELASGLEQACSRFEDYYPPHGKAFVTMMRGLLAAADGRLKEAGTMLEQADVGSEWVAGYLRLAREWVKLLERFPAMPPAPPQPRPAPAP